MVSRNHRRLKKLAALFAVNEERKTRFLEERLIQSIGCLREQHPQSYEHLGGLVARGALPETARFSDLPELVTSKAVSSEEAEALERLFQLLNAEETSGYK